MPNLSIKDVPDALAEALRQRAARNHRSLQGELMSIIEAAAASSGLANGAGDAIFAAQDNQLRRGTVVRVDARGRAVVRRGTKTVQEIATQLRAQFPNVPNATPSSVDIIRAARDSR
jgi:plasmid stability protein